MTICSCFFVHVRLSHSLQAEVILLIICLKSTEQCCSLTPSLLEMSVWKNVSEILIFKILKSVIEMISDRKQFW